MADLGFEVCGEVFYGHMPKGVIQASAADLSVPRTCTLPKGHKGSPLSDPTVLRAAYADEARPVEERKN